MKKLFSKIVDVKPNEVRALWLGFILFFVVLAGYYVIRPIRDNIGATQFENLWWMFTVVLVAMIVANALFSMIVARMSRRKFIPIAYRFFILNLVIFFVLMQFMPPGKQPWVDGCLFVWVSVFNLFATAVFWGFMTDIFTNEQGKRLFGFIAVGGSLGGMLGPLITASLVHRVSTGVLLLICAGMLEIAAQSIRFFPAEFRRSDSCRCLVCLVSPRWGSCRCSLCWPYFKLRVAQALSRLCGQPVRCCSPFCGARTNTKPKVSSTHSGIGVATNSGHGPMAACKHSVLA